MSKTHDFFTCLSCGCTYDWPVEIACHNSCPRCGGLYMRNHARELYEGEADICDRQTALPDT